MSRRELTDAQPDAAAPLFHVSAQALAVGQRLRSYTISTDHVALIRLAGEALNGGPEAIRCLLTSDAFARLQGQGGYQVEMVLLEAAFERVRGATPRSSPVGSRPSMSGEPSPWRGNSGLHIARTVSSTAAPWSRGQR